MPCQITVPGHVLSAVEVCKEILFLIQTFNVVFFFAFRYSMYHRLRNG